MYSDYNPQLDADYTYTAEYTPYTITTIIAPTVVEGSAPVTVINGGGGGQAVGPNVTFTGGSTGMNFIASGNTLALTGTLVIANGGTGGTTAAAARANLSAALLGINDDITRLIGLTGSGGWGTPTGTATKTTFDTATVTLPELAERVKAIIDVLMGQGIL